MTTTVRAARPGDHRTLHSIAAATFPLATPAGTAREAIDDFIATTLSEARFADYLVDADRELFLVEIDGVPSGYTMLVYKPSTDPEVLGCLGSGPSAELSKCYLLPGNHGSGAATLLMQATVDAARNRGAAEVWLGVNQENERANRFYDKSGFAVVGTKHFMVGGELKDDYVRSLAL